MNRPLYWGAGLLILLLIAGGSFLFYSQYNELQQLKQDAEEADKQLEENNKPMGQQVELPKDRTPPPDASPNGHWHDGVWHDEPHEPVKQTSTRPLTYHEELLKTNPVKALRLQAEERGHWSAEHIPPFPPDDTEAQDLARNRYLLHYYESIGDKSNPIYSKAARAYLSQIEAIRDKFPVADTVTAREMDLNRIIWTNLDAGKITPYGGMTRYGRARMFKSDYFPDFIDVPK